MPDVAGPTLDVDLYSREALEDSTAIFATIRAAGPAVWLPRNRMWAIGRFDDVRAALRNDEVFVSGRGVAANPITNVLGRRTTISSDGEQHTSQRRVLMRSLGARPVAAIRDHVEQEARRIVDELLAGPAFDGSADFASALPIRVVADLVGINVTPKQALRWASNVFDGTGPLNRRTIAALPVAIGLLLYTLRLNERNVRPRSWAASVFEAHRNGELNRLQARQMVLDFVVPSLDTTILAASELLWQLGRDPDSWSRLRADRSLIAAAVVEAVRLASPVRLFTRYVTRDVDVGGVTIPAGTRAALLYASANLDETRFPEPERFRLDRPSGHLGWGNGPHTCVGLHLAKLEMQALLAAMVERVNGIEVWGATRTRNNALQGLASFNARFTA